MMTYPSDPYSSKGMEALVNERALLKLERDAAKREALKAELKASRELVEKRMESKAMTGTPFPEDCVDKLNSNKVLEKILLNLTDLMDVISAYNACTAFQNVLESKRKVMLLPEVLTIFFQRKFGFNHKTALRDILSLRLVSKSWRNVVDKYLFGEEENTGYQWYFVHNCRFRVPERDLASCRALTLETTAGINRGISLLSKMSNSDRKLYSGRVRVRPLFPRNPPANSPEVNEFYAGVSEFLERFGDSIWEISLTLWEVHEVNAFQLIQYWAPLMPGLKKFKSYLDYYKNDQELDGRVPQLSFPSLSLLRECICNKGDDYNHGRTAILPKIIRANPWIRRTNLNLHGYWKTWGDVPIEECLCPIDLLHLLELGNLPASFKPASMDITGLAPHLSLASWPLKELALDLGGGEYQYLSAAKVFPYLERFKETLTHLVIDYLFSDVHHEWPYLDLPNLKTLSMSLHNYNPSLDFMLPMKALENLYLDWHRLFGSSYKEYYGKECLPMFRFDVTEKIRFKGLLLQMEGSNITQVFPFLQKMVIRGNGYDDGSNRIQYFRQGDVMKLGKKDENILMNILQQFGESCEIYLGQSCLGQVLAN